MIDQFIELVLMDVILSQTSAMQILEEIRKVILDMVLKLSYE